MAFEDGPGGQRNYTEDQLFVVASAKTERLNSTFLIRNHNLTFKMVKNSEEKLEFVRQDLVVNIEQGFAYTFGQMEALQQYSQRNEEEDIDLNALDLDVHLDLNLSGDYSPFVSQRHCVIGKGKYSLVAWIKDLNSKYGTFLNGRKLRPNLQYNLANGDTLSLGIDHNDPQCRLDRATIWVFKIREVSQEEKEKRDIVYPEVLENGLILGKILGNLGYLDLLGCRSVSKFWSNVSLPMIQNRTQISLQLNLWNLPNETWETNFIAKSKLFKDLGVKNLAIFEQDEHKNIITAEIVQLFQTLFQATNEQLIRVSLTIHDKADRRSQPQGLNRGHSSRIQLFDLLFNECRNLEEMQLNADISSLVSEITEKSTVRKLKLWDLQRDLIDVLKLFPNLEEMELENGGIESWDFRKVLMICASEGENLERILPKFKGLSFDFGAIHFNGWNEQMGQLIEDFPIKLQKLEIRTLELNERNASLLESTICRFSSSLKQLILGIRTSEMENLESIFRFPQLDVLEKLEIQLQSQASQNFWSFVVLFDCETVALPELKSLIVICTEEWNANEFIRQFKTDENTNHFPKLKHVHLSRKKRKY